MVFGMGALFAVGSLGLYAGSLVEGRWQTWLVRMIVWAIGSLVALLVLRLFKGSGGEPSEPDAIEQQLGLASKRLSAAGAPGRGSVGKIPVVVVLGPKGSAKSTFVTRSGLDAEHLAGNLYDGPVTGPTEMLNVWYHAGTVILEAGGDVVGEPIRWSRLVQKIQPDKWIPALFRRPQAPRVAVVCYSAEELLHPGGSAAVLAAAASLRDRLSEFSESIGIRLPVYVVFTKSDGVPHFREYVENFTDSEIHEIVGATLRASGEAPAGSYKERESSRIQDAFDRIYQSLSERRLEVLSRAGDREKGGKAYEFPREFRKLSAQARAFLVELCRPSQLGVSPFLRGFYFTGVRPVLVGDDAAPEPVGPLTPDIPRGATQVFNVQQMAAHSASPPPRSRQRRVPQPVFLQRILRRVVFEDRVAMGMTTGGFGLNALRRATLTVALVAVLLVGIGVVIGHGADRQLRSQVATAIAGVQNLTSSDPSLPSQGDLQRLDDLRAATQRLSQYENGRRPLRRLVWLYSGEDLYDLASRAYFDRFERVLLNRARREVAATLSDLPDDPTLAERDQVYDALKTHVEMTDYPDEADSTFFAAALADFWAGSSAPADSVRALARAQFGFYGSELGYVNPYPAPSNELQVNHARGFLADHTNAESLYRGLLGQANALPSFSLGRDLPETGRFLSNSVEIPGAFTSAGWNEVTDVLADPDRLFNTDVHVVGNQFYRSLGEDMDRDSLAVELIERYESDYVATWREFLASTTLVRPGLAESSGLLSEYGSNRSALFLMLGAVDEHTRGASQDIVAAFAPVHVLVGPDSLTQPFSAEYGGPYLERIRDLAQAAGVLAASPGSSAAQDGLRTAAAEGAGLVGDVQIGFPTDPPPAAEVSRTLVELLGSPFEWGQAMAGQGSRIAVNELARRFCADARVLTMYPFVRGASDAAWTAVDAFFRPESGVAFTFFEAAEATGSRLNSSYGDFKNRVGLISRTFYPPGTSAEGPAFRILVSFDGTDPLELEVDGQRARFTATQRARQPLAWDATRAESATLTVQAPSRPAPLELRGTWALFRLYHLAEWEESSRGVARVRWTLPGGTVVSGEVSHEGAPLLDGNHFEDFRCPTIIGG